MNLDFIINVAQAAEEAGSSGVVGTLGLNLKLFIAQLINFAIVLFVLWKWVFTPITKALSSRTEKIEASLKTAESIAQERQQFSEWQKQQMTAVRQEAGSVLVEAKNQAEALRNSMLIETREQQEQILAKTKTQLEAERTQTMESAKAELANLVIAASEKILGEKLDSHKDKELITKSISEVNL
jgi:F-type H+-transporting ATPase subunit b